MLPFTRREKQGKVKGTYEPVKVKGTYEPDKVKGTYEPDKRKRDV